MRMPSGHTKSVIPSELNLDNVINTVGVLPPPTTDALVREAKLICGQALIACRGITDASSLAKSLGHICNALSKLISIDKLEKLNFNNMSDAELRQTAEKLIKELN